MARKKSSKKSPRVATGKRPKSSPRRKRRNTPENKRGGFFARLIKAFFAVHRNHTLAPGKNVSQPFSKKDMAEWLQDDFDRDMDDNATWYEAVARSRGASPPADTPEALRTIQDASKLRNAERAIQSLMNAGLTFKRTDAHGNPLSKKKKKAKSKSKKKKSSKTSGSGSITDKVYWTYDPNGPVTRDLLSILGSFKITGFELEGIIGCTTLLKKMYGLPMEARVRDVFKRLIKSVSDKKYKESIAQKDVWCYLFRRPGKYETRKYDLQSWNDATILRCQCAMEYTNVDTMANESKTVAAFGTIFSPEEDSIYLIGCEPDRLDPAKWQKPIMYKLDRVVALKMLPDDPNPELTSICSHPLVSPHVKPGAVDRLDLERLLSNSAGMYFHYGKTIRMVVRIHSPRTAAWCIESPFHRMQTVEPGPGRDEITISIEKCFLSEMVFRLLRLGGGFTVIEPPELGAEIHKVASDIAARHTTGAAP